MPSVLLPPAVSAVSQTASQSLALPQAEPSEFRDLTEQAPVVLWCTDPHGACTYLNRAWRALTGQTESESLGHGWLSVVHPEDAQRSREVFEAAHQRRQGVRVEYRLRRHDGVYRTVLDQAQPRLSDQGEFLGLMGSLTDTTDLKAAQSAVLLGEARFRRLFESDLIGLVTANFQGQILEANDAFLKMVGYSRQELESGRINWAEMTPPQWREVSAQAVNELKTRGFVPPFEKEYFAKDGTRVQLLIGSTHVAAENLNITFLLDISARKAADARLRFLSEASHLLANSLESGEETLEQVARLAAGSVATCCLIHRIAEDGGRPLPTLVAHRDPEEEQRIRASLPDLAALAREVAVAGPKLVEDGSELLSLLGATSLMVVPIRASGRTLGMIALATSKPVRGFTAAELPLGEELAYRVAAPLENARLYREAQVAIGLRDEFLAVASHELRTPLTPLLLKLQSLRRDAEAVQAEALPHSRLFKGLDLAESQLRKLTSLVDSLLDVARLGQGRLALDPEEGVDLAAVTREVVAGLGPQAERAGCLLEVAAATPVPGRFDQGRLEQILQNLIGNAIKYGAGRPVRVEVTTAQDRAVVTVRDQGIGIAPEALPRLFGKFQRAVSDRHYGGLGLGLYITRQIVQAMGGSVRVESVLHQGALFTVELPRG